MTKTSPSDTNVAWLQNFLKSDQPDVDFLHLRKGEVLFRKGNSVRHVYLIRRGQIRVDAISPQGKAALHELCVEHNWLEEGALDNVRFHVHTAVALMDSDVIAFDLATFRDLLRDHPPLADMFMDGMAQHIKNMRAVLDDQLLSADMRLGRALHAMFKGRNADTIQIEAGPTRLAEMTRVSRTTANRVIDRFKMLGIMKKKDKDHYTIRREPLEKFLADGNRDDKHYA